MQTNDTYSKIDIQPLLNDVNEVVKKGVNKLLYDFTLRHLNTELDKCKLEMEFYKSELTNIKELYGLDVPIPSKKLNIVNNENISLNIEEKMNDNVQDNSYAGCTFEKILLQAAVSSKNERVVVSQDEEEEDADAQADDEEEAEEEADDEEEEEAQAGEEADDEEEEEAPAGDEEEKEEEEAPAGEEADDEEEEAEEEEIETENEEEEEEEEEEGYEEEEEVFEIEIDDITYFTTDEENGPIYEVDSSGDPGNKIGYLKDGGAFFLSVI